MGDDLGVGLGGEDVALAAQRLAQLAEILDDAVVDDGHPRGRMGVGIVLGGTTVRRPAGMADADRAGERLGAQHRLEILQLALGAAAHEASALERGDSGGIIAAIFEPLQRLDEPIRDRLAAEDPRRFRTWEPLRSRWCRGPASMRAWSSMVDAGLVDLAALDAVRVSRKVLAQPGFSTGRARATTSASGDTSLVTTEPVPM